MCDLADVVEGERLEIREGQVQMATFQDKKARCQYEKKVIMAFSLMLEVIVGNRQLKLKENPDVDSTEKAVLKAEETNKIRGGL